MFDRVLEPLFLLSSLFWYFLPVNCFRSSTSKSLFIFSSVTHFNSLLGHCINLLSSIDITISSVILRPFKKLYHQEQHKQISKRVLAIFVYGSLLFVKFSYWAKHLQEKKGVSEGDQHTCFDVYWCWLL